MRRLGIIASVLPALALPALAQPVDVPAPDGVPIEQRRSYESSSMAGDHAELRFYRWGEMILVENVMINAQGPFRFILDTGAEGAGRLDRTLVERLSIPSTGDQTTLGLLGQDIAVTTHRLDTLSIGPLTFRNVEMLSRDYNAEAPPGLRPFDGILGFHLFSEYLLTINYPARTLSIDRGSLPEPDGQTILPIISDDADPEIQVTINDRPLTVLLDTGAMTAFAIPNASAQGLEFLGEPRIVGREGDTEIRSATVQGWFRLGAVGFENPQTIIAPSLNQAVVGIRAISSLALTFDQANARVRIERPDPRPRYGLAIGTSQTTGLLEIREVTQGGIAAAAGILPTDRLTSLNGQPIADVDRETLFRVLDEPTLLVGVEREGAARQFTLQLPLP